MPFLYLDVETAVSSTLTLDKMGLYDYLSKTHLRTVAWALDDEPVDGRTKDDADWTEALAALRETMADESITVVGHNVAFDLRAMRALADCPWPGCAHDTLEMAQNWTPNQPGGYSLKNLSQIWLDEGKQKAEIDLKTAGLDETLGYNKQDVEATRALHKIALSRMHPDEIRIMELCQAIKELDFTVDTAQVQTSLADLDAVISSSAEGVRASLTDEAMNRETDGTVRSVKPHEVKRLLLERMGFDCQTISAKKLNADKLRANPQAAAALAKVGETNKALSHKRNARKYASGFPMPCELTYFSAHTGRFSSRNSGKGLNLHNCPKRNPAVAKPLRSIFTLPDHLCFVRGDFANVEYRVTGLLTGCRYTKDLFDANPLADPYSAFWKAATGQTITKKDPARQVAKAAVLGLGYGMGIMRWMEELGRAITDPTFKVTLADLDAMCAAQGWSGLLDRGARMAHTKLHCPPSIAIVANHTRTMFHDLHPEYFRVARWLVDAATNLSAAADPHRSITASKGDPCAAMPGMIGIGWDRWLQGTSMTVTCGPAWPCPTVTWRDLAVRSMPLGYQLSFVRAGAKPPAAIHPAVAIENVAQSAARNGLCRGLLDLDRMGYQHVLHVHDEVMLVVPRDTQSILDARRALLDVYGPNGTVAQAGYQWSVVIDPSEVGVSRTLWEEESFNKTIFQRLEAGEDINTIPLP